MKKILLTITLLSSAILSQAQGNAELGFNLGFSTYLGDLQMADYSYRTPGLALGGHYRYNMNSHVAVKAFMNVCRISGDDASSGDQGHINRNLSFRSNILEYGGVLEINALPFNIHSNHHKRNKKHFNFTPYFFGGFNIFHFNPKTEYNGSWVDLQPLNTEGQNLSNGFPYHRTQVAIPFGAGLKFQLNHHLSLGLEIGMRKTFTDYLDDVSGNYVDHSTLSSKNGGLSAALAFRGDEISGGNLSYPAAGTARGNSNNMDWYTINTLSLSYRFY
ncbi:MAG: DUF6089 family protein [Chitinophagaceae bacterium]